MEKILEEIKVKTSKGILKAVVQESDEFPGILLYLNDELYARLELYEDTNQLRLIGYNDNLSEEPVVMETLKHF